jgi:pyruvate dehydrogenase (quinone)
MARTVGTFILERLRQWGVRRIFGYPGDGIDGIMGGFHHVEEPRFIQVRHEEMAAFMACAHAKFTGEVGVCLATSGPGAIHLLNGLYDAQADHQPVVAIVGQSDRNAMGGDYQQEVDLHTLFKDVAHEYVQTAMTPTQIRQLVDRAMRIATGERAVTCIIVPKDLQELEAVEAPKHEHGTVHTGIGHERPRVLPTDGSLDRAAEVLNAGERVAMLVGQGALGATPEVSAVAERLGAGVAKALLGKCVLPDDLPYVTGSIGLLGTKASWDLMQECDTLLMIGSSFPYSEFLPEEGKARGVQIDLAPRRLSLRYPMEVSLVGDAAETLRALLPRLAPKEDRRFRARVEKNVAEWWKTLEARAMVAAQPLNPQRVFWELSPRLPDNAILTADSGTTANWFARDIRIRPGMMASLSGGLATMGPAVPYAIAAKFAYPDRVAVALAGDGAMQMNGLNELITIAKYWREWSDPRLVVLVLNNRDLNMVTWEQRTMSGDPKLVASQDLPDFPYAGYAESLGLRGIRVDRPEALAEAWSAAFAADRPVVVEAVTDPEVPPLPPHITFEQARALASALRQGDVGWRGVIRQVYRDVTAAWRG